MMSMLADGLSEGVSRLLPYRNSVGDHHSPIRRLKTLAQTVDVWHGHETSIGPYDVGRRQCVISRQSSSADDICVTDVSRHVAFSQ